VFVEFVRCFLWLIDVFISCKTLGCFHAMGTPKMQSQKRNFTILQLQDFLMNYGLYEMLIPFGFYI
jgi:hypothetical protein